MARSKRPADTNQKAKSIVDIATGDAENTTSQDIKNAAAALGRKSGLKGGPARAKALSGKSDLK
jgi:hypothetical protein